MTTYLFSLIVAAVFMVFLWGALCWRLKANRYMTAVEREEQEETYLIDRLLELRIGLLGLPVHVRMKLLQDFQTQANGCISKKPNGNGMNTSTGKSWSYPNLNAGLKP